MMWNKRRPVIAESDDTWAIIENTTTQRSEEDNKSISRLEENQRKMIRLLKERLIPADLLDNIKTIIRDEIKSTDKIAELTNQVKLLKEQNTILADELSKTKIELTNLQEDVEKKSREMQKLKGSNLIELNRNIRTGRPVPFFPYSTAFIHPKPPSTWSDKSIEDSIDSL